MIADTKSFASGASKVYSAHLFYLIIPVALIFMALGMSRTSWGAFWNVVSILVIIGFFVFWGARQYEGLSKFSQSLQADFKLASLMFRVSGIVAVATMIMVLLSMVWLFVNSFMEIRFQGPAVLQVVTQYMFVGFVFLKLMSFVVLSTSKAFPDPATAKFGLVTYSIYLAIMIVVKLWSPERMSTPMVFVTILLFVCFAMSAIVWKRFSKMYQDN